MKKTVSLLAACLLFFALAGCSTNNAKKESQVTKKSALKKVSVVLDWTPNTNHTGLYVAKEKGYFKDQGLDVKIVMPGKTGADQLVASGKADFGIGYQENITQARIQGVPLVSIAAIIQHNSSGFASPAAKNITSPKDFEGKKYGGWGSPVEKEVIDSLMKTEKADVNKVKIINIGDTDFFTAVKRDVDFTWIYYGWTGVEAEMRGEPINMVYLTDYSKKLDYYTPVLETSEKMIAKDPETVQAFMNAVTLGYQFSIEHPDNAADILSKSVPDLNKELVKKSQEWLATRYQAEATRWGEQKQEVWENYATWMYDHGLLDNKLDAEKAFTNDFLPK
jgi:ABC-type nitrate/sulfonate/bicarbonate transport system substrate-binding protein